MRSACRWIQGKLVSRSQQERGFKERSRSVGWFQVVFDSVQDLGQGDELLCPDLCYLLLFKRTSHTPHIFEWHMKGLDIQQNYGIS
jgi:hypothetical protein